MQKENVLAVIKSAFSGVVLSRGIGLWQAQSIDDYESRAVQNKTRKKDEKEDWSLLAIDELQRCQSSLSFFDADGMRFHLPAFIIASLGNEVDDPIFYLTQLDSSYKSKFSTLNQIQRKAIVVYLNWCLGQEEYEFEHPAINKALSKYWGD